MGDYIILGEEEALEAYKEWLSSLPDGSDGKDWLEAAFLAGVKATNEAY